MYLENDKEIKTIQIDVKDLVAIFDEYAEMFDVDDLDKLDKIEDAIVNKATIIK